MPPGKNDYVARSSAALGLPVGGVRPELDQGFPPVQVAGSTNVPLGGNGQAKRADGTRRVLPIRYADPREDAYDAYRDRPLTSRPLLVDDDNTDDDRITPRVLFPDLPAHRNSVGAY